MKRQHINYPGYTAKVPAQGTVVDFDKVFREGPAAIPMDDLFIIPAAIHLGNYFRLQFKAWRSIEHFETFQHPLVGEYLKTLRVPPNLYDDFYAENQASVDLIHSENLSFLGVDATEYDSTEVVIDLDSLTVTGEATRKGVGNQTVRRVVSDPEEFQALKDSLPEFETALIGFAIQYGKANSGFLSRIEAVVLND